MNDFSQLWKKLAKSKRYREEFVAAQVKRGIPFQIRTLMKGFGFSQEELARRAGLTQGVVSRAASPDYGNLTLNTIIRIAAGFDVAFIGKFVPFSELAKWFTGLSEEAVMVRRFDEENSLMAVGSGAEGQAQRGTTQVPSYGSLCADLLNGERRRQPARSETVLSSGANQTAAGSWL